MNAMSSCKSAIFDALPAGLEGYDIVMRLGIKRGAANAKSGLAAGTMSRSLVLSSPGDGARTVPHHRRSIP